MDQKHRKILDGNLLYFAENLDLPKLLIVMEANGYLKDYHIEEIHAKRTNIEKRAEFVRLLKQRGPTAFKAFYDALIQIDQGFIAERLEPGLLPKEKSPIRKQSPQNIPREVSSIPHNDDNEKKEDPRTPSPDPELSWKLQNQEIEPPTYESLQICEEFYRKLKIEDVDVKEPAGVLDNIRVIDCPDAPSALENFNTADTYPNFSNPKGLCLLFNNRKFNGVLPERHGTDVDERNAQILFSQLGYTVKVKRNHTAREMKAALARFTLKDHGQYGSAVVIVLSHGLNGQIYGSDAELIDINEFVSYLNGHNCPGLRNKPKLFFIQACRGETHDPGFTRSDGPSNEDNPAADPLDIIRTLNAQDEADANIIQAKVPGEADVLVAFATTPGYVSWRNSVKGSWFIQAVCTVFSRHAHSDDLLSMLTKVNNMVVNSFTSTSEAGYKQVPEPCSRLLRKFYFFPGVSRHEG